MLLVNKYNLQSKTYFWYAARQSEAYCWYATAGMC